jgi:hypothetical protein
MTILSVLVSNRAPKLRKSNDRSNHRPSSHFTHDQPHDPIRGHYNNKTTPSRLPPTHPYSSSSSSSSSPLLSIAARIAPSNLGCNSLALVNAIVASPRLSNRRKHFPSKKKTFASSGAFLDKGSSANTASFPSASNPTGHSLQYVASRLDI